MSILGQIAFESIKATDDAVLAGEPTCICREGAYLGAQMLDTPIRCERCKRIAWTVDHRIIRELKDALDEAERGQHNYRRLLREQNDECREHLATLARVEALAADLDSYGISSVYESSEEIGQMIYDALADPEPRDEGGEDVCRCEPYAYIGTQMAGEPTRCERCRGLVDDVAADRLNAAYAEARARLTRDTLTDDAQGGRADG